MISLNMKSFHADPNNYRMAKDEACIMDVDNSTQNQWRKKDTPSVLKKGKGVEWMIVS